MHFRDRTHSIQIVRTSYDEEAKKSKQTVVGTIPKRTLEVEEGVMEKATPEEQAEIRLWIERNRQILAAKAQAEAYSLNEVVRAAITYLDTVTDPTERTMMREMMQEAAKRLRRATRDENAEGGGGKKRGKSAEQKAA